MKHFTESLFENFGDYLHEYDIMDVVEKTIGEISKLHPDWAPDRSLLSINIVGYDSTRCLGNTKLYSTPTNEFKIDISLSKYLLKEGLEDLLINTFAHEYGHYLVNKKMLGDPRVHFIDGDIKFEIPELDKYYRDDEGHSPCWYEYVNQLTEDLHLRFKITAHPEQAERGLYEKINEPEIVATIYCPNNDIPPIQFYEKDPEAFLQSKDFQGLKAVMGAMRGALTCNVCESTLEITYASEELKQIYQERVRELFRMFILAQLTSSFSH